MSWDSKVLWTEGLVLQPPHFQQADRYTEALVTGLARLDPKALTQKIEAKGGGSGFLKNRKAQYWETYEAMYAEISDQAENDFNELFAREFAKAYKDQLARLKAESQSKT